MLKRRRKYRSQGAVASVQLEQLEPKALLSGTSFDVFPDDSIQEAVDAASDGDTVRIHEGVYYQHVSVIGKSLTLQGVGEVLITGSGGLVAGATESLIAADEPVDGIHVEDAEWVTIENIDVANHMDDGIEIVNVGTARLTDVSSWNNGFFRYENDAVEAAVDAPPMDDDDAAGEGITSFDVNKLVLRRVSAYDNQDDGVDANNTGWFVGRWLDAYDNGGDGLDIDAAIDVSVVYGAFDDNGELGLDIDEVDHVVLSQIHASHNDDDGANVTYARTVTVSGAEFYSNYGDGIDVNDIGRGRFTRVAANDNSDDGLDVDAARKIYITRSEFNGNGVEFDDTGHGIDADDVSVLLRLIRVTADGNGTGGLGLDNGGGEGVEPSDTRVVIRNSWFNDNGYDGVSLYNVGRVDAVSVRANSNGGDGIFVEHATHVRLVNAWANDNDDDGVELFNVTDHLFARVRAHGNSDKDIVIWEL